MRTKQLNKLKKIGGNKFDYFESFKRKGGSAKPGGLDFLSLPMLIGLEDTSEEFGSTTAEEFKKFVELKTSI